MADKTTTIRAVGRRKTAAARVRIETGKGEITINGKTLKEYFPVAIWQQKIMAPLEVTDRDKNMNVSVKVAGGGPSGQAGAVLHGIARALIAWDEALKPVLKAHGFLTRDPRAKERKKPGRHKARRGHQWRKR
ncbi:MAG: 30S ribosomal protein S9 [Candidatus Magasanikbacteria bacterium]|uniref:Small ribosomal subunit protein uS9 n=1 Tax=Candidatus Magasanikbacteria bacterium CG10_big_fil_rev_8_21_14_0_10_38_6 TaxID=1974647 RepID=A0A2M6P0I4_9BACT|nr:30S ribosomal protein S9 [Candidatus Magasanikbacteria bacterium]NCS72313.1 30S ribosomal protein S9 [Candidatus Magasanikbacteria bacterium]PIR77188.1 MAG: 30S ribosomal protein S9 [Candidatus Magasanikbacteria bacterium CG10_big_fil_rev_8_21_14_0_10_38_6]